jgi:hypothetical protein
MFAAVPRRSVCLLTAISALPRSPSWSAERTTRCRSVTHAPTAIPLMAWTVGDGRATDVVGHVLVIHGPYNDRTLRAACGVIE